MLLLIDNYDSFTYNVVQYLGELGAQVDVRRNDAIELADIEGGGYSGIVMSPGPCTPNEAGVCLKLTAAPGTLPIFGICLGHQVIAQAFGGVVTRARKVMHGKTSEIHHDGRGVFEGLSSPLCATRYHSLIAEHASLPECLEVSAWTQLPNGERDEIMGLRHRERPIEGVQFHPESIASESGHEILRNFLLRLKK
jgi:anthranilate synthase component 2